MDHCTRVGEHRDGNRQAGVHDQKRTVRPGHMPQVHHKSRDKCQSQCWNKRPQQSFLAREIQQQRNDNDSQSIKSTDFVALFNLASGFEVLQRNSRHFTIHRTNVFHESFKRLHVPDLILRVNLK